MPNTRSRFLLVTFFLCLCFVSKAQHHRETIHFNQSWLFAMGDMENPPEQNWQSVTLPHDWSIRKGYSVSNTAASTGFVPGGIGWYKKEFQVTDEDREKTISIEFDGVYCNSSVWINGHLLGFRPNGYSSFSYDLTPYIKATNELLVRVDHSSYVDARWYTGSGIYRNVRLVKKHPVHIAQWGNKVTTVVLKDGAADIHVATKVEGVQSKDSLTEVVYEIIDPSGTSISRFSADPNKGSYYAKTKLGRPLLWSIESPHLYDLVTKVKQNEKILDQTSTTFGIRSVVMDADKGFVLNGKPVKIKGVNIHHDAGALGAAVTKDTWKYRLSRLQEVGVNAIRLAHNPHSPELLDLCDEMGLLVMGEFFDEWKRPKGKSLVYLGDNAAKGEIASGYSNHFWEWAERDLKDLIHRDYNHPSVVMWSIGNEIEWTFPAYTEVFNQLNPELDVHTEVPVFEPSKVKSVFDEVTGGFDSLAYVAQQLSRWVKEVDTTRAVTCGSVRPSISMVSGYGDAVDVLGLNYRAMCYAPAHATYPTKPLIGSENWGTYEEWKSVEDKPYIMGIFAWTGFAYMGEAGPWPRKGLNLSFFDFAGFKTPRGHFFETLWKPAPKVYAVTTKQEDAEFSVDNQGNWDFEMQKTPPPVWSELRKWEWYPVNEHWNYSAGDTVIVQVYTNCEEVELFLNDQSLGKQALANNLDDHILKWEVPYKAGALKAIGYDEGKEETRFDLTTNSPPTSIVLESDVENLGRGMGDRAHIAAKVLDSNGNEIRDLSLPVTFHVSGGAALVAVDNGWEKNVQDHYKPTLYTHKGRALGIIAPNGKDQPVQIKVTAEGIESKPLTINLEKYTIQK
ncbi:glycoside hydrolase family 2 TIM barrel-domain containing protein [Echinicola rosea]|nr:glycoside hydrolase family 2 TIM barrel-domain containing protein [Echinicola rosea]